MMVSHEALPPLEHFRTCILGPDDWQLAWAIHDVARWTPGWQWKLRAWYALYSGLHEALVGILPTAGIRATHLAGPYCFLSREWYQLHHPLLGSVERKIGIQMAKTSRPYVRPKWAPLRMLGLEATYDIKPWPNGTPNSSQLEPSYQIKTCTGGWPNDKELTHRRFWFTDANRKSLFRNYILSRATTRTENSLFSRPCLLVKHVNACALIPLPK